MIRDFFVYLRRESNPDLIFRRDLFYPFNYRGLFGGHKVTAYLRDKQTKR